MKIAWFTPLDERSAIGRFSAGVTRALASSGEQVEIWRSEDGPPQATALPVRPFEADRDTAARLAREFDLCVYNFGNYLPYHESIYRMSRLHAGLAVMHDMVLHHFFAGWYLEKLCSPEAYFHAICGAYPQLRRMYPSAGEMVKASLWTTNDVGAYPFAQPAVENALAAVCHSRIQAKSVAAVWPGPVTTIPLAYELRESERREGARAANARPRLVVIGHINPNKCVPLILAAMRELPPVELVCAGPCDGAYEAKLREMSRELPAGSSLRFTGYLTDREMEEELWAADICLNLRRPVTEGASASVIEEMLMEKTVLVFDVGCYSEMPDECVVKVTDGNLAARLQELLGDPDKRERIGLAARKHAQQEHSYAEYAARIRSVAMEVVSKKPVFGVLGTVSQDLARWGMQPADPYLERIAGVMENLFS